MLTLTNRIDMRPGAVPLVIHRGQYDSDFTLVFELYSSAGNFTVESGTTAMIRGTKTDGHAYDADATIDVSAKTVTVAGSEQMTAAKGRNIYELVLKKGTKVLSTANFILDVERAAMDAETIASESVLKELNAIIAGAETATEAAANAASAADRAEDAAESVSSASTQIATNTADIADLKADIKQKTGLSEETKIALLDCFEHVAWIDEHGQTYYDNLYDALYPDSGLDHITAVFTQGSLVVYPNTPLGDLKPYLTVTGYYKDGTSGRVSDYALSGTLAVGISAVTVSKDGKTATFNVTVSQPYWDYEWSATSGIAPTMMQAFAHNFTDYADENAMFVDNFYIDFNHVGNCEILFNAKKVMAATNTSKTPQISIRGAQNTTGYNGFKTVFNTPSKKVETNASGSFAQTSAEYNVYHEYRTKYENGVCSLYIDGTLIEQGPGVIGNEYIYMTGIFGAYRNNEQIDIETSMPYTQMAIKEIKFKVLS